MYEIYQGISHPGCIPAYPGYGYMNRDLWQTITSSHLVLHTKPGRIKNFKLSGVTRQVETTGAQLFDASKIPTYSKDGATVTNNGDGSFTVSGNGTLTSGFSHAIYLENEDVRSLFRPGEIYIAESPTKTRPYFEVNFFKNDQNVCELRPISTFLKATLPDDFFAPENNLRVRYIFYGDPGLDIMPGTIKPMMYQDGDGTWEPYTGSQPSPSPEYPQDVQGVGVRTKNLLNEKRMLDFILQRPGASIVQFDGRRCLKLDGSFNLPNFNLFEGFEAEKRYTLTFEGFYEKYYTSIGPSNGFAFEDNSGERYALIHALDIGTWKRQITTTDIGVKKLYFSYGSRGVVYIDLDTLQLEEGTVSTPYEPYGYRTDVVCKKEDDTESYTAPIYTQSPVYDGDSIQLVDGQYCHVQNSMIVDGASVKWVEQSSDVTSFEDSYYSHAAVPGVLSVREYSDIKSTHFPKDETIKTANANGTFLYNGLLGARLLGITTLDAFKSWMAEHNPQFLLPRAEPRIDPLPAISQQALRNLPTYKGTTIIDTTDPLEPEITVSYLPQKKNFFNPEKVFSNPVPGATRYFKYDLGLSPGSYRWNLQKNEFLGSGQYVLFTDDLEYEGSSIDSGKIYQWIGHSTLANFCFTSGAFSVTSEMYMALYSSSTDAVKQLLKTLIIEKI